MRAEEWIKEKWASRIKGDDFIAEERPVKLKELQTDPQTGEVTEVEREIGIVRVSLPITTLASHFREVIEDDVNFPEKKKKREGLLKANVNPDGTTKIPPKLWESLLKEALG